MKMDCSTCHWLTPDTGACSCGSTTCKYLAKGTHYTCASCKYHYSDKKKLFEWCCIDPDIRERQDKLPACSRGEEK